MDWQPIETAPKDFTTILGYAVGADNRPLHALIAWGCPKCVFRSDMSTLHCDHPHEWLGHMAARYGVTFTHWMPLPAPPQDTEDGE